MSTMETVRVEFERLVTDGWELLNSRITEAQKHETRKSVTITFGRAYQKWYTKALPVVKQLLPDRLEEFIEQYRHTSKGKQEINAITYSIRDYISGITVTRNGEEMFSSETVFLTKFSHQLSMLDGASSRLDSILLDIRHVLQSSLFDETLTTAEHLHKAGHVRAAGALAGVALEEHLGEIVAKRELKVKKDPTIAELAEALKTAEVLDVPTWRFVQHLGDIRNFCVHKKQRDPTPDEVVDLIRGIQKIIKTVY